MIANTIKADAMMMATHLLRDWEFDDEDIPDMRFCCRLHGEDGTPVRYNFAPNAFCSYGETPEERQQREAAEQDAWESMQMMCNPEDGSL